MCPPGCHYISIVIPALYIVFFFSLCFKVVESRVFERIFHLFSLVKKAVCPRIRDLLSLNETALFGCFLNTSGYIFLYVTSVWNEIEFYFYVSLKFTPKWESIMWHTLGDHCLVYYYYYCYAFRKFKNPVNVKLASYNNVFFTAIGVVFLMWT